MITLCLAHHAMVTRTKFLRKIWPELLRNLWREQHPDAHEQLALDFTMPSVPALPVPLDFERRQAGVLSESSDTTRTG